VTVTAYRDEAAGIGQTAPDGTGRFLKAVLRPQVTIAPGSDAAKARAIHWDIHKYCFIARSVNFPVKYEPTIQVAA
jgi:organic hydroperoxide reductase OsmC/OhrA